MQELMACFESGSDEPRDLGGVYPWVGPARRLMIDALSASDPALRVRACRYVQELIREPLEYCGGFGGRDWAKNPYALGLTWRAKEWAKEHPVRAE